MQIFRRSCALLTSVFSVFPFLTCAAAPKKSANSGSAIVFVGTYTGKGSNGIYSYRLDPAGKLTPIGLAAEVTSPSFLAIHPNRRFLYAVSEVDQFKGEKAGAVSAFAIDAAGGKLKPLNTVSSRGAGPCYVSVDRSGKDALIANYEGGSVAVLPIKEDGSLGEASAFVQHSGQVADAQRQGGPHGHSINPSPDNRFAVAADLGLDELIVYKFDAAKGSLAPNDPPYTKLDPRSGPRHFAFHPSGKFAYAINEIASTVTALSYDKSRGILKALQTISTLPKDFTAENSTAEIQVHPSGKFVYGSNRGHDSIAVFAVDPGKGTLRAIEQVSTQGKTPRNFGIDPTGSYLLAANQDSRNIVVFRIDPNTGRLTATGEKVEIDSPVCVRFLPTE
jgi:6-phosphogluconolactonase